MFVTGHDMNVVHFISLSVHSKKTHLCTMHTTKQTGPIHHFFKIRTTIQYNKRNHYYPLLYYSIRNRHDTIRYYKIHQQLYVPLILATPIRWTHGHTHMHVLGNTRAILFVKYGRIIP